MRGPQKLMLNLSATSCRSRRSVLMVALGKDTGQVVGVRKSRTAQVRRRLSGRRLRRS